MEDNETRQLSAMLDGELENHQAPLLFSALRRRPDLRQRWAEYALIGEALRGEKLPQTDLTARVMAQVRLQPVVLAPRTRPFKVVPTVLALAASLTGVAVVAWLAFAPSTDQSVQLAKVSPVSTPPVKVETRDMREYLLAHHAQVSSWLPHGATQHIRTVAAHRPMGQP